MALRIPKVLHRIWLGGKPIPEVFETWWQTWIDNHREWAHITWTDSALRAVTRYPDLIDRCPHLSQQSNIYRWELLLEHGGVYVDTDFECCKNIEPLLDNHEVVVGQKKDGEIGFPGRVWYVSAFAAAVPRHPLFQAMVDDIPNVDVTQTLSLGSKFLTRHALGRKAAIKIVAPKYLYPYRQDELQLNRFPRRAEEFPDAYAVHHWAGKWRPDGFKPL